MLILRHCRLSSEDLITCERALLRFTAGRAKKVDFDFNVWDYAMPEIYGYILGMFVTLDLVDCLGIDSSQLLDFIIDVDHGYQATFYHSFYHAADVTAVLYYILEGAGASQYLSKPEMAALLLAGLCHDIGHPGLNNLFQVNAKTELVKLHGEASVLEKHSCSLAMELVTKHSLFRNIARSPSALLPEGQPATDACMRDAMVKAILATDMAFHYDMLGNLNNLIEATMTPYSSCASDDDASNSDCDSYGQGTDSLGASSTATPPTTHSKESTEKHRCPIAHHFRSKSLSMATPIGTSKESSRSDTPMDASGEHGRKISRDWSSSQCSTDSDSLSSPSSREPTILTAVDLTPEQRQNLCNCLLHAADISNAVRPWTVCKRWSDLVVQEFFRQGDIEKAQGLPVSPCMDRDVNDQSQISLGFGDFVVQPYFGALIELFPAASSVMDTLTSNREQWLALQETSRQFWNDPYRAVDPLEDPRTAAHPSSPGLSNMLSGRRVSVAAGVLVLDGSRTLRVPTRRTRHSSSLETAAQRKMRRSHSGWSLSTSMQNLRVNSQPTNQSPGKGQEVLMSALKRQASLTERGMSSSPYMAEYGQRGNFVTDSTASKNEPSPPTPQPRSSTPQALEPPATKPVEQGKQRSSTISSGGGGSSRQMRLASLQVASQVPESIRKEYGDGYPVLKDQPAVSTGDIPSAATDSSTSALDVPVSRPHIQSVPSLTQAGSRSSTPAVMMNKIKYDWPISPTLDEIPTKPRFGLGPLDSVEDSGPSTDSPALAGGPMMHHHSLSTTGTSRWMAGSSSAPTVPRIGVTDMDDALLSVDKRAVESRSVKSTDGIVQISTAGGAQKRG